MLIITVTNCPGQTDTTTTKIDSIITLNKDELPPDNQSFHSDSNRVKSPLEAIVYYPAEDSTIIDVENQKIYLFGKAKVKYEDITLESEYIAYDFGNFSLKSYGIEDSTGRVKGKPIFSQGSESFTADTIVYNFKSQKARIFGVRSNDGESFIQTYISKKQNNGEIHNYKGKYTTCSNEKPHYHFSFKKMVAIPDDKIITGPTMLKIGNVPTPLVLPFGFFPNTQKQKQGVLIPSYGESSSLGFYLLNGGYYIPISPYFDTQITGDIYTRGSWGLKNLSRYKKRYHYGGSFQLSSHTQLNEDQELPTASRNRSFSINWNHTQDPKASPGRTFNTNVNIGSSNRFTNNLNSSQQNYISSTFASSVSYSKRWNNKPYQLSANLRHSQNTVSQEFNFTLPQLAFSVDQFFLPLSFLKNESTTKRKWFEKIGVSYATNFENKLTTHESNLALNQLDNLIDDFRNGMKHDLGLNTSLKFGFISLNPSVRMNERWHFKTLRKRYDPETQLSVTDTLPGFRATRDFSLSASATTKYYGMFRFKKGNIQAIRHVMTPSLGFSYRPEFDYLESGLIGDSLTFESYNPYTLSSFTQSSGAESGNINFNLMNNLEMKYLFRKDTTGTFKKSRLIENISMSTSYNVFADSLNLSNINLNGRTTVLKHFGLNANASYDPYANDTSGTRINRFRWTESGAPLRLVNARFSLNANLKSKPDKKKNTSNVSKEELDEIESNQGLFVDFTVPWNLNFTYTFSVNKSFSGTGDELEEIAKKQRGLLFNGDFRILEKWKIGFTSGYDFDAKDFTPTTLTLYWDLHCWEFQGTFIPFGERKSYNIQLNVKASILQDLKLQKRNKNSGSLYN